MKEIQLKYEPRDAFLDFHNRTQRWASLVCHRRAGKTVACVNDLVTRAVYTRKKNARYGYIAPFFRQAKDVAWVYLKEACEGMSVKIFESSLTIELFNGSKIILYGADNPDAMRGVYFDGIIVDEYGDCRPSMWGEVILPTLADRKGWAVFIRTPKGKNHFYDMNNRAMEEDGWYQMTLKASTSGLIAQTELDEMKSQMSEDQYLQEFEVSFEAAVKGTYYANTLRMIEERTPTQVTVVDHDPDFPVDVFSDLGYTDSSSYWFVQKKPDGWAIIDYEEAHSQPLQYYFDLLNYKNYEYDTIWLPHDAKAKSLQTGRSTIEQFLEEDFPVRIAPKLSVQHGIDAVRLVLPMCWFDDEKCYAGIEALRAYRRSWDEVKKIFSDNPVHDWASHGSDAFRQFALVAKTRIIETENKPNILDELNKPPEITLNGLWEEHELKLNAGNHSKWRI